MRQVSRACKPLLWLAGWGAASVMAQAAEPAAFVARLNDTGVTLCSHGARSDGKCAGTGQDGEYGRDASARDDTDGHAGFSFVKLDAAGQRLPASATAWSCVGDKVTGLVWEMKTADGGLHDYTRKFTNWNDSSRAADTGSFIAAVNAEALCGKSDWRLPTRSELQGLVDYSTLSQGPTIDAAWFPNSAAYSVWTSSIVAGNEYAAWYVNFQEGFIANLSRDYAFGSVRLVRSAR